MRHAVEDVSQVPGKVCVPSVAVDQVSGRDIGGYAEIGGQRAKSRPFPVFTKSIPGLVRTRYERVVPGRPEAVDAYIKQLCELPGKVLDMHAGPPVYLRRVLLCKKGNTGQPTTFSPLPITTMPLAEMVKRLASISGSTPT